MSKIKSYIKEAVARMTGDTAAAIAEKNYRFATSSITTKISEEKHNLLKQERVLATKKERLNDAFYPKTEITDEDGYLQGIRIANNAVIEAEETVSQTKLNIEFLEKTLEAMNSDVDA